MFKVREDEWRFNGSFAVPTSAGDGQPWVKKDTSAAGAPTMLNTANGLVTTLASNSEEEIMTLYFGDILSYDIDQLIGFEADFSITGFDAVTTFVLGMASAQNDTEDSVAAHAWFRVQGSASLTALLCETDDGTNDNDDKAAGVTLGTGVHSVSINFMEAVQTQSPPGTPKGGKGNVIFNASQATGLPSGSPNILRRCAKSTLFDMSNYAVGLQPFMQLHKASGTGVPAVTIKRIKVTYRDLY